MKGHDGTIRLAKFREHLLADMLARVLVHDGALDAETYLEPAALLEAADAYLAGRRRKRAAMDDDDFVLGEHIAEKLRLSTLEDLGPAFVTYTKADALPTTTPNNVQRACADRGHGWHNGCHCGDMVGFTCRACGMHEHFA